MENALTVHGLTKTFGDKIAVDSISFEVKRGDILGLLGPNGAGKTTAIRMIMGILAPDRGEVAFHFNGRTTSLEKRRIGYLPEERGLYDDAGVLETLIYLATLKDTPREQAKAWALDWLHRFGLKEYANHKLEKLSKGMQQKVQFIATVLHQPEVVMLDEPFSGLDPLNQDLFMDFIRELQNQGTTILLSAHQMNMVEELCQRIFMINQGRQVLYGSLEEIKRQHQEHLVTLSFPLEEDPSFLKDQFRMVTVSEAPGRITFRYSPTSEVPSINELLGMLSSRLNLEEVSVQKPPLHDIFVQKVQKRGESIEDACFAQRA